MLFLGATRPRRRARSDGDDARDTKVRSATGAVAKTKAAAKQGCENPVAEATRRTAQDARSAARPPRSRNARGRRRRHTATTKPHGLPRAIPSTPTSQAAAVAAGAPQDRRRQPLQPPRRRRRDLGRRSARRRARRRRRLPARERARQQRRRHPHRRCCPGGGLLPDPGVLVYRAPGDIVVRLDGFADRDTVAQAATNAPTEDRSGAHNGVTPVNRDAPAAAPVSRPSRRERAHAGDDRAGAFVRHAKKDGRSVTILARGRLRQLVRRRGQGSFPPAQGHRQARAVHVRRRSAGDGVRHRSGRVLMSAATSTPSKSKVRSVAENPVYERRETRPVRRRT